MDVIFLFRVFLRVVIFYYIVSTSRIQLIVYAINHKYVVNLDNVIFSASFLALLSPRSAL